MSKNERVEEIRKIIEKCLPMLGYETGDMCRDLLSAYDAKCAEIEGLGELKRAAFDCLFSDSSECVGVEKPRTMWVELNEEEYKHLASLCRGETGNIAPAQAQINALREELEATRKERDEYLEYKESAIDSTKEIERLRAEIDKIREAAGVNIGQLQSEVGEWATRNFGDRKPHQPILLVAEECGELCHSVLKKEQGIRGTEEEHQSAIFDAVGDIVISLADACNLHGIDFEEAISKTWAKVRTRDWKANKIDGAALASAQKEEK